MAAGPDLVAELIAERRRQALPVFRALADPAAGQPAVLTVPGTDWFELLQVTFRLQTSAATGQRTPYVELRDGDGQRLGRYPVSGSVPASTTAVATFALGTSPGGGADSAALVGALPPMFLPPGFQFAFSATALDASDQVSQVRVSLLAVSTAHVAYEVRRELAELAEILPQVPSEEVYAR